MIFIMHHEDAVDVQETGSRKEKCYGLLKLQFRGILA